MIKYLIWGTGKRSQNLFRRMKLYPYAKQQFEIVAFISNDTNNGETLDSIPIISPSKISEYEYDYICIWSTYEKEIREEISDLGISPDKVKDIYEDLYNGLKQQYEASDDPEINEIMKEIDKMRKPAWIYYYNVDKEWPLMEAFFDESKDMFFVMFEGKRMYLSCDYKEDDFIVKDGKKYIGNVWAEQDKNSPHRYEEGDVCVKEGDVIVDCGACEGNFTLHNIDKVSKAYIIECDPGWQEALRYTFEPYRDKVVFCNKFVSDKDTDNDITIDSLVKDRVNYIKMDIEGEEIAALRGAKKTLDDNQDICCSICAYHRHGDAEKITK